MVADRRLSFGNGRTIEDAQKITTVETTDGVALIGYAGLGLTQGRTQPSHWLRNVLRGRNASMNASMEFIVNAMRKEMPRHLRSMPTTRSHVVIAPAFVDGRPRIYYIDLGVTESGQIEGSRYALLTSNYPGARPYRMVTTGSGANGIPKTENFRHLFRLAKAFDEGRVQARSVADAMAAICYRAHLRDKYTGPNAIVVWRSKIGAQLKDGGGLQYYSGMLRDNECPQLPDVARGMDMNAIVQVLAADAIPKLEAMLRGSPIPPDDPDLLRQAFSQLPIGPDDRLR